MKINRDDSVFVSKFFYLFNAFVFNWLVPVYIIKSAFVQAETPAETALALMGILPVILWFALDQLIKRIRKTLWGEPEPRWWFVLRPFSSLIHTLVELVSGNAYLMGFVAGPLIILGLVNMGVWLYSFFMGVQRLPEWLQFIAYSGLLNVVVALLFAIGVTRIEGWSNRSK